MTTNSDTLLLVFVALTGVAVLLQAFVLLAIFLALRKTTGMLQQQLDELRTSVMPVVTSTQKLLTSVGPNLEAVAKDLAEITKGLSAQSADIQASAGQILAQVQRQTSRIDAMFTRALDTVDRAGTVLTETINMPLRQISAITAFARAALGALRSGQSQPRPTRSATDEDMFM